MPKVEFDAPRFFQALDATRAARRLNWKQVAAVSGVSASTLTRLAQAKRPDVDSMAALVAWSGVSADDFVKVDDKRAPEALSQITTLLNSDLRLSPDARSTMINVVTATYQQLVKPTGEKIDE